jgi:sigma-B regulation protein RsbU (phosphoserine phosphatase)
MRVYMFSAPSIDWLIKKRLGISIPYLNHVPFNCTITFSESIPLMTLFYLAIDPENEQLQWVRVGHDPAILYDPAQNTFEELAGTGIALGVNQDFRYEAYKKTGLSDEQIVAIGTDGIWEARNPSGEMFGKKRF